MRRYETTVIVDPDVSDDERKAFVGKIGELIPRHEGFLLTVDDWGNRKLAYEIRRKMRGYYYRFDFCGNGVCVDEMERSFRIDDRALKYMTILLDNDANLEALKEEMAKAQEEARIKAEEDAKVKAEAKAADEAKSETDGTSAQIKTQKADAQKSGEEETKTASAPESPAQEENNDAEEE